MAEPIGLASGLITLISVAFKSSIALYNTIQSFRFQPKRVRDLMGELEALHVVLQMLTETLSRATDTDLSALEIPLRRCSDACKEFEKELLKCCSRSGGDRTSFRDWAKLTYMGDGIDGVRQLLAGYKSTINIALTDATLRTSSITTQTLENHQQLIKTATDDFESHLQDIDEKLDALLKRAVTGTDSNAVELRRIKDERESTEKGLELCRQLSAHIDQIQVKQMEDYSALPRAVDRERYPERIVNQGLQECRNNLNLKVTLLEQHLQTITARLRMSSEDLITGEDKTELIRLLDESETVRQCMSICTKADAHIQENVSIIDNYATGDETVQFLASTNDKTINGRNRGFGYRQRQIGGHFSDETAQQLSKDAFGIIHRNKDEGSPRPQDKPESTIEGKATDFGGRFGRGYPLDTKPS
ncbi:Fc.00g010930.m01.CDS01 [Cosmosporella sp. VM-42]